jgi:hypothetical protein
MAASPFFRACGGRVPVRFGVGHREVAVAVPVIIAGTDPRAELLLPAGPPAALAFFLVEGRLFAVPLERCEPVLRNEAVAAADWVAEGDRFEIAGCEIVPLNPLQPGTVPDDSDPQSTGGARDTDLRFEPATQSRSRKPLAIFPRLTLVGRSDPARFKINFEGVAAVHAAILRTPSGPWIADLTRRDLTLVNDGPVSAAKLRSGDLVSLGGVELIASVKETQTAPVPLEAALGPMLSQVAQFQQQTFDQFREMLGSMTQMFGSVLQEHREFVKEEFARLERVQGQAGGAPLPPPPAPALKAAEPKPSVPYVPPETVTPIHAPAPGHSAPPPNVELHAWLQSQVANLEKVRNTRWKRMLQRFKKKTKNGESGES